MPLLSMHAIFWQVIRTFLASCNVTIIKLDMMETNKMGCETGRRSLKYF